MVEAALNWLVANVDDIDDDNNFDFPDYAGMPVSISSRLSSQEVDIIQENWEYLFTDPQEFVTNITSSLWN